MEDAVLLDHKVELYIPTQCICGKPLDAKLRSSAASRVKSTFHSWFGGCSVSDVHGVWKLPSGAIADEPISIVFSQTDAEGLEGRWRDLRLMAVQLADELSQDAIALVIDGAMSFYSRSNTSASCAHARASVLIPVTTTTQAGRGPKGPSEKARALHAALSDFRGLETVKRIFRELLEYEPTDEALPFRNWPADRKDLLVDGPQVLCYAHGFRIVYLRLADRALRRTATRQVIEQVFQDNQAFHGMFVVSNTDQSAWELVNVKASDGRSRGRVLRRMALCPVAGIRTATERLMLVDLEARSELTSLQIQALHDEAFDVEQVTRLFFQEYRRVFEIVEGSIEGCKGDVRLFTQRLFNRLLFIEFISRKGWLSLGGDRNYLVALYRAATCADEDFYHDRLYWTFFHGLGTVEDLREPHELEQLIERRGEIPYLNGGLFEMVDEDDSRGTVKIPNESFRVVLVELFGRFNFTVHESTPLDEDVAVDPEMLGKVFEELVTGRHETGSYYTPKPIVSFMCREALKGYLASAGVSAEAAAAFVDDRSTALFRESDFEATLAALKRVRVVDPACGSGAYLLGMLHELLELRRLVFNPNRKNDAADDYQRKLEIIQNNLYGVDLDPFAVNVARLRLWLSLAVEHEGDTPEPLPNLDFKIECGDSLIGPNPQGGLQVQLIAPTIARLADLKSQYASPYATGSKPTLRKEIGLLKGELTEWAHAATDANVFNWQVEFAEVFADGGFDVVLANPPYVRQELIRDQKSALKRVYGDFYCGTADLYCYFYERGLQLLRQEGMLVYISPNKWMRTSYGANLRSRLVERCRLHSITDFGDLRVFQAASAYAMILVAQADGLSGSVTVTTVPSLDPPYPDLRGLIHQYGYSIEQAEISGTPWSLTEPTATARLRRMEASGPPLLDVTGGQIFRGVLTGLNAAFFIDGAKRAELISLDPRSSEVIRPLALGRDLRRWCVDAKDRWLICALHGIDIQRYPAIEAHVSAWRIELTPKATASEPGLGRKPGPYRWYEIQDNVAYFRHFAEPKILYQEIATYHGFTYDETGLVVNNKVFMIPSSDLYLLGVLNSAPAWEFLNSVCTKLQGGALAMQSPAVSRLPIPDASEADRAAVAALARQCLDARGVGCEAWEAEINERVSALYGL